MPERIQLSRAKGWRKPANTIVVARPSRWGNPFHVRPGVGRATCVAAFRDFVTVVKNRESYPTDDEIRAELAGKNLACWCPLDEPCHADVLLEVANR